MSFEEALQEHEEQVDALLNAAKKYVKAVTAWKKACHLGHLGSLARSAALADELSGSLPELTAEGRAAWTFDAEAYLLSGQWRTDIQSIGAEQFGLRTLEADGNLISSPVTVRAQAAKGSLLMGSVTWPRIRPSVVAAELKRLRDNTSSANSKEFVEALYSAAVYLSDSENPHAKFRAIYDLFCVNPVYRRENSPASFGQQIYALHRSEVKQTRGGRRFGTEYSSGNATNRDVFMVTSEDNAAIKYYLIWFK